MPRSAGAASVTRIGRIAFVGRVVADFAEDQQKRSRRSERLQDGTHRPARAAAGGGRKPPFRRAVRIVHAHVAANGRGARRGGLLGRQRLEPGKAKPDGSPSKNGAARKTV